MRSTSSAAEKAAREAIATVPVGLSTVRVRKALHHQGGSHRRCTRLRCRQADQGQEAACSGRYARLAAARHRHRRTTFMIAICGLALKPEPCSVVFPWLRRNCSPTAPIRGRSFTAPWPASCVDLETEIVKRSDRVKGFVVQPRRWVAERTIASLNRCIRFAKDWENHLPGTRSPSSSSRPFDSCSENFCGASYLKDSETGL